MAGQVTKPTQSLGIYRFGDLSLSVLPRQVQTSQSTLGSPLQYSMSSQEWIA